MAWWRWDFISSPWRHPVLSSSLMLMKISDWINMVIIGESDDLLTLNGHLIWLMIKRPLISCFMYYVSSSKVFWILQLLAQGWSLMKRIMQRPFIRAFEYIRWCSCSWILPSVDTFLMLSLLILLLLSLSTFISKSTFRASQEWKFWDLLYNVSWSEISKRVAGLICMQPARVMNDDMTGGDPDQFTPIQLHSCNSWLFLLYRSFIALFCFTECASLINSGLQWKTLLLPGRPLIIGLLHRNFFSQVDRQIKKQRLSEKAVGWNLCWKRLQSRFQFRRGWWRWLMVAANIWR